jgi:hypothetical protein
MYTDNGEKKAIAGLQAFEQVRYFFLRNTKNPEVFEGRVRIIAFSSEKEFKPYRMNAGNFAYYQPSHERDYIVMQDIEPAHHQAAVHEYTHLIIEHSKLNLPLWLNEGMAEGLFVAGARRHEGFDRPSAARSRRDFNQPAVDGLERFVCCRS